MAIGQSKQRLDAEAKVTGRARYTDDMGLPGMRHAAYVHSTIAHGMVLSIDASEALALPGVEAVFTADDVPGFLFPTAGHPYSMDPSHGDVADRLLLTKHVRYYGDEVAVVVARDGLTARKAAHLVKVEYEPLPVMTSAETALAPGAPVLQPSVNPDGNLLKQHTLECNGTLDEALAAADVVVEGAYRTPTMQHCHLENQTAYAYMDDMRHIVIVSSTQIPHICRRVVGQALGIPWSSVRVIKPYIGGGFGNKQDVLYEPLNAFLTTQVGGRGVRMEISREETLGCTRVRHAIEFKVKAAARKDGTLVARKLEAYSNQGGYASHAHAIVANSSNEFKQIYKDEKVLESDAWTVYTNLATGGAMRGYGIPQAAFAAECMADDLALALRMDPLEFRKKNCMRPGYVDPHTHVKCNTYGLAECMEKGREFIRWDEKRREYENQTGPVRKGIGMAIFCYKTGVYPISLETASCRMILNQDGSMQLQMGATEIGQGADTVFTQMAAEVTGITEDKVNVLSTQDTDVSPFDTGAYASRQTYVSGMAVKKTGAIFKEKILDYAAYMLEKPQDTLDVRDNHIVDKETGTQLLPMEELATTAFYSLDRSVHITAEATSHCKTNTFATGVCFAEVEVDMPLGKVKVTNIVNVHDSGKLINPKLAAAQVHGGMSMGLGYGLSEELLFDAKGRPLNDNLLDYKLPTAMDTPDLNALFVELDDPTGPFGNKALGEPPAIPVAPAVRNAVLNATGVAVDSLPMDPQKMVKHFKEAGLI